LINKYYPILMSRLVPITVAAAELGVGASTLRRWMEKGLIPDRRTPGGHRRFDVDELRAMLDRETPDDPEWGVSFSV
jgi:excisionase family DNA binding protein